ncbi:hypothetical protein GB931_14420 [Modestobacter sp. I12A-02628]|uniref:Uncharacterized protein n=1 Tax=Goekera deserti TaxID=2497753 RepID=A0A7K3WJ71_9ACTN|nr:hypothetical protein [Goekera deserti]MPQ99094.1 hypothetical protein [Goekera deserti]NDI47428.1 hypothetical protein [Goekera deserti]NEL55959.1 hypothetical protein [Goekera deserti]
MFSRISTGAGFGPNDDEMAIKKFLANMVIASNFVEMRLLEAAWPGPSGLQCLCLVFRQVSDGDELNIEKVKKGRDGTHTFAVEFDWLSDVFLDPVRGPWEVLTYMMFTLTTLHSEGELQIPHLPAVEFIPLELRGE